MWDGFRSTMEQIRNRTVDEGKEFGLLMEQTSELSIPYVATYWSRQ